LPLVTRANATVLRCSWDRLPAANDLHGASVIFVRYVTAAWRALIKQTRHSLVRLIYFMDDDLFDWKASRGLSWRYRFKLLKRATWQRKWLLKMQPELWVSTPWLQQKYAQHEPYLVLPTPLGLANYCNKLPNHADSVSVKIKQFDEVMAKNCNVLKRDVHDTKILANGRNNDSSPLTPHSKPQSTASRAAIDLTEGCVVFYHGTGSHQAEIDWLLPVVELVLAANTHITFEIIGNTKTQKLYRHLKRVTVTPQMKWPAYQAFIQQPGRHIGLAPMLEHPFNLARSYTKFFDIHRAGAAGIYAEAGPWQPFIEPGKQGVLVTMQVSNWVGAILDLAADQGQRARILEAANKKIHQLKHAAERQNFEASAQRHPLEVNALYDSPDFGTPSVSAELSATNKKPARNKLAVQRNAH
jgi:hypothetical protein